MKKKAVKKVIKNKARMVPRKPLDLTKTNGIVTVEHQASGKHIEVGVRDGVLFMPGILISKEDSSPMLDTLKDRDAIMRAKSSAEKPNLFIKAAKLFPYMDAKLIAGIKNLAGALNLRTE